jgi:hypothetical protein
MGAATLKEHQHKVFFFFVFFADMGAATSKVQLHKLFFLLDHCQLPPFSPLKSSVSLHPCPHEP